MASTASNHVSCGYNGHYHLYMTITQNKRDASTNQSNVTVKMYAQSDSNSYGAYNLDASGNTVKMTVNGKQVVSKTMAMDFRNKATVQLASWTGAISHGSDGSKKLDCSGSFSISGSSYLSGGSISCSIQLESIPRATKPTLSSSSVTLGKAVTINISPAVSSWTHNIYYRIGTGNWTRFATGVKANYSWTVPLSIANSYPSSTNGTITIGLNTYNGSTQIGGTQTVNLNISIPASIVPSVSSVSVAETTGGLSLYGYVQYKSKLKITASVSGSYSSSIKSYNYYIGSQSYSSLSNTYTMGEEVRDSGNVTVTVEVTDSRGRTAKNTASISVLPYSIPQIWQMDCTRCGDASGSYNTNGGFLKVTMGFSIAALNNKNGASYKLEYSLLGANSWSTLASGSTYNYSDSYVSSSAILNSANSYNIRLTVADNFTNTVFVRDVGTVTTLMSYIVKKFAFAIGKAAEISNTFEVALETVFNRYASFMSGVGIAGDLKAYGNVTVNNWIEVLGNIWINKNSAINVTTEAGNQKQLVSTYGESAFFGYGNYDGQYGDSYLLGKDVFIGINPYGTKIDYRPYYRRGDTIDVYLHTSGYATTGGKDILFLVPLSKPIIGSPTVSVSSINGLVFRQNNSYPHNSSNYCKPASYRVTDVTHAFGFNVRASFDNNTGVTNNSPIGIVANIRITFS